MRKTIRWSALFVAVLPVCAMSAQDPSSLDQLLGPTSSESQPAPAPMRGDSAAPTSGHSLQAAADGAKATPADAAPASPPAAHTADTQPASKQGPQAAVAHNAAAAPVPGKGKTPARSTSRFIEEIIVTAQKREENIQNVPISISAFSASKLDAEGVTGIRDIGNLTPGLQFTTFAGYTLVYLRGVGTDTFIPSADQSVATYLDGVYFPSAHALGQSFGALKRIEVLKGPQGTLFGRNSTGGAINVITQDPGHDFGGSFQSSFESYDDTKTRGNLNVPITSWLAAAVSGFYDISESYYKQDVAGKSSELPHDIATGLRLKVGINLGDDADLQLTGLSTRTQGPTAAIGVNTDPSLIGSVVGIQPETRAFVTTTDDLPSVATDINAYYAIFKDHFSWLDVKATGSYFNIKTSDYRVDFDGSNEPLVTSQSSDEFQISRSAELQLLSNDNSWGHDWFKYILGFYYYNSLGGYSPVHLSVANSALNLPTGQVVNLLPDGLRDLIGFVPLPSQVGLDLYGSVKTNSYSGYLQTTFTPFQWVDLTLGARYQQETRRLTESNVEIQNLAGNAPGANPFNGDTTLISFAPRQSPTTTVSPRVALDFHVIDGTLLYASFSRGFKSATYNVVNLYVEPEYVQPEKVTAYEIGTKSTLLDGNLQLDAAIFQNNISDLQASFVSLLAGGAVQFQNAGKARIRGAELDATWVVLPDLDPGFVFTFGGSFLNAKYTEFKNGSGFAPVTGLYNTSNDFSGNDISRVPRWTGSTGISQTFHDVFNGTLEVAGEYHFNSGFYFLAGNTAASREHAYATVSARASYLYDPLNIRITLFGQNLSNTRYRISQFFTDFGRLDTYAEPRSIGVRLNYDF